MASRLLFESLDLTLIRECYRRNIEGDGCLALVFEKTEPTIDFLNGVKGELPCLAIEDVFEDFAGQPRAVLVLANQFSCGRITEFLAALARTNLILKSQNKQPISYYRVPGRIDDIMIGTYLQLTWGVLP